MISNIANLLENVSLTKDEIYGSSTDANRNNNGTQITDITSLCTRQYRTKQEIYDEIVFECAEIERNKYWESLTQLSQVGLVSNRSQTRTVACSTNEFRDLMRSSCTTNPYLSRAYDNNMTLQYLIQLLVTVAREHEIWNDENGSNSPESLLQRKRLQNREAATRYRKRQKELKEEAELELTVLVSKNNELKYEIKQMQSEIERLKAQVLRAIS
ncbi:unnamed protein product [Thelazia callipaeda]|uniref:BZIP domain-containing protein n=1 Tax=Thelazia callipaeda TaxID=103827 RepID=A0A0N5CW35_THECL|nr:unnamed protein product [Thelazia callipaeda]